MGLDRVSMPDGVVKGPNPLIWLLIDGLSWSLVNRHRESHAVDHLARCPFYPLLPLSPNCQTPPSLFSIFSGTPVSQHGLTGYLMPAPSAHDLLAVADAFEVWPRDIAMVWDEWAAQGIAFRLCALPFVQPHRLGSALLGQSSVYEGRSVKPEVIENGACLRIGPAQVNGRISVTTSGAVLEWAEELGRLPCILPLGKTVHLPVEGPGTVCNAVALRAVTIEGRICVVSFGYREVRTKGFEGNSSHAYVANDLTMLYRSGRLGRRLDEDGQGAAEWLLLELMREMHESFCADIVGAVAAGDAQRVIGYYPVLDLLSHHLLKYLDAGWASVKMLEVGRRLFDELMSWVNDLIARCRDAAGRPVTCIAHSDHGMTPVHHDLYPNAFFERQGWLVYDTQGVPDMKASSAVFHPADNGLLLFHQARLGLMGLTPESVTYAWREYLDKTYRADWQMFEYPSGKLFEDGWTGSHYWQAPGGTRLCAKQSQHCVRASRKGGDHTVWANDPWLRGVLIDASDTPLPVPPHHVIELTDIRGWLTAKA